MASSRLNLRLGRKLRRDLLAVAKHERVTVEAKARELLELGLALEEDLLLTEIAEKRLSDREQFITHEQVWD